MPATSQGALTHSGKEDLMRRLAPAAYRSSRPPCSTEQKEQRQDKAEALGFGAHGASTAQAHASLGSNAHGNLRAPIGRGTREGDGGIIFWATHNRAELDLLHVMADRRVGFEFKYSDSPKLTPSMRIALEDLELDRLTVIVPGLERFPLAENVEAVGLPIWLDECTT